MIQDFIKKITRLGHDTFRVAGAKTLYFDPYEIAGGDPADVILITHEHFDHCSPDDVAKIQQSSTVIVTEKDSAAKLSGDVRIISPGETTEVYGMQVTGVPAYNIDKDFHPKANGWLGFVVEMEGVRLYHAGDTDFIPEMRDLEVDIALLPVSGTYVMNVEQAIEAARAIAPKVAVPMHYGAIVGSAQDAETFKRALSGQVEVVIL